MKKLRKINNYWNHDRCVDESEKYKTKTEFQRGSYGAYKAAKRNGWLDEIYSKFVEIIKPKDYWNFTNSKEEALKYKTKTEFQKGSHTAYKYLSDKNLLDESCSHMDVLKKPNNYWNFENCLKEALKYKTKKEFFENSIGAYNSARKNDWVDKICVHMNLMGNLKNRQIYACEFSDNHVYIGLTCNVERRKAEHFGLYINRSKKTSVLKHIEKTSLLPNFIILTNEQHDEKDAMAKEEYFVNEYEKNGWILLNMIKTGGLGSNYKWNKEKCKAEALKYTTKKEFVKKSGGAYNSALKNRWLDEICSHMIPFKKEKGYWDFENCRIEAAKYKTKEDFKRKSSGAYCASRKNKWLPVFFPKI